MNWLASSPFRFTSASLFSAVLLLAATGCEDPNDLGVELPGTTPVNTEYRDFPVNASTVRQAPVETLNSTHYLVGQIKDEQLGTTTAKTFANLQFLLAGSASVPSQYANPILDSAVVVAGFDQVYGSSAQPVSFDVYRLPASLDEQATYNSDTEVPLSLDNRIGTQLKSSLNRKVTLKSKLLVNGVSVDSVTNTKDQTVRLTLYRKAVGTLPAVPSPFIQNMFSAIKDAATPFNQTILNSLWKGIAIVPADNFSGTIVGFSRALENRVIFYYHVDGADVAPVPYPISFESTNASAINAPRVFTQIRTSFVAPFNQLTDPSKSVSASVSNQTTYMQEGLGLGTKLEIPGLAELLANRDGLAINRAELLVPLKSYSDLLFTTPPQAFVYELDANNKILQRTINISPYERLIQGNGYSQQGVNNNATALFFSLSPTNKYYSISVTSYLQAYIYDNLGGERPAAFMLNPVVRYSSASLGLTLNRAALDAQNIKLRVYFSKLR
jgi:hypothetical protein